MKIDKFQTIYEIIDVFVIFLLFPKQEGIRARTGFPFISETKQSTSNQKRAGFTH